MIKNQSESESDSIQNRVKTLAALVGCISIYGITISLFTPLLSIILESRGINTTIIGGLAMMAPVGIMIGSFAIPHLLKIFDGRKLLIYGVVSEVILIFSLMNTQSIYFWFVIRFLGGLVGSILFVVTETWIIEITPREHHGKVMGFYNTTLALSLSLGPLMLSITGTKGLLPFLLGIGLMTLAGLPLILAKNYVLTYGDDSSFGVISFAFVAPLLALACFVVAFKEITSTSLLPVYGLRIGMSENSATLMLFFGAAGGALLQLPIGWAADHFNPRKVFIICALVGLACATVWPFVTAIPFILWATLFLWWGFFAGIYTISMIFAGKWFKGKKLSTAMASFGVFWGLGAFIGPFAGGASMDLWDPHGLPLTLFIISLLFFVFSLFPSFYINPQKKSS